MNGFLTRLVQRGAGLPTMAAPARPAVDVPAAAFEAGSSPSPAQSGVSDRSDISPVQATEIDSRPPARRWVPERQFASPEGPLRFAGEARRADSLARADVSHVPQRPASSGPMNSGVSSADERTPGIASPATESRAPALPGGDPVAGDRTGGVEREPNVAERVAVHAPAHDRPPVDESNSQPAQTLRDEGRDAHPPSLPIVGEVIRAADPMPARTGVEAKEDTSLARVPAAAPVAQSRLPLSSPRDGHEEEGEQVEVHIGRIEVKVASPPAARPVPARQTKGFDRYRSVRRAAGRNWY